jgi:hypothetical protein
MSDTVVKRFAIVGVGSRASFYYSAITKEFTKTSKLVGFCDLNQTCMVRVVGFFSSSLLRKL